MGDAATEEQGVEYRKTLCWPSPGCHCNCGLLVKVKDNRILGIKGNPEFPYNRGSVCAERLPHFRQWLEHPDQLMHPLKRTGERGENRWERISWDRALDEIAERLQSLKARHGAECLSFIEGTYRSDLYAIRARFTNLFGNPANVGAPGTACACNKVAIALALAGANVPCTLAPPIKHLNCLVLLGRDYTDANPVRRRPMQKWRAQKPEAKLIVVDPRRTELAKTADFWLQIRPGTDTALLMAWIHVIIDRGLVDRDFVEQWTYGFEQLKRRAAEYTPERASEITWIPAEQIVASAIAYAGNKPGCIHTGLAPDQFGLNAARVEQARLCLHAITGNMKGGAPGMAPEGPGPVVNGVMAMRDSMLQMAEACSPEQRARQLGSDRFKLMTWPAYERMNAMYESTYGVPIAMSGHNFSAPEPAIWRSVIDGVPYPTRALITWGSNPLLNAANTKLVYRALKSPNLNLHVVLEHFMTPTAMLADYVLPAASKLERPTLSTMEDFTSVFIAGERAIRPIGERKSDYYFFRGLAVRLGLGEYFPWETEEDLYDYRLQPLGITFEEAATRKYVIASAEPWTYDRINPRTGNVTGFATRSGRFELYSNLFEELGYDPLPFYEEPPESPVRTPEIAADYPLILIDGGRFLPQFQSEHRQLGMGLREQHPDPLVEIHPETARSLNIREGDWTEIETPRGAIRMKAKLTAGIDPRVVHAEHNWWFPEQPGAEPCLHGVWQSNVNVLTTDDPDACDPLTGAWPARALLCRVRKAPDVEIHQDKETAVSDPEEEDFAAMFEASLQAKPVEKGEIVEGRIVALGPEVALVDVGGKGEAVLQIEELTNPDGEVEAAVGDVIQAMVVSTAGGVKLSRRLAGATASDRQFEDAFHSGLPVEGRVERAIKGGYEVRLGRLRAFCPISQIDVRGADAAAHEGQTYRFRIIEFKEGGSNIVVSRRALLEEEQQAQAAEVRASIVPGAVLTGRVASVRDFGAFVDLGAGVQGLLHVSEMSWSRVSSPAEMVKPGEEITVKVLRVDEDGRKISLGLKQLSADPWTRVGEAYTVGQMRSGRVTRVAKFGAFVELEPGIEALAHASTFAPTGGSGGWSGQVSEGMTGTFEILSIEPGQKRIGVALVEEGVPRPAPAAGARSGIAAGVRLAGKVERHEKFGVFVFLAPGRTGLIPMGETGIAKEADVAKALPIGSEVDVVVLEVDPAGRRIRLSAKAAQEAREAEEVREWAKGKAPASDGFGTLADKLRAALGPREK